MNFTLENIINLIKEYFGKRGISITTEEFSIKLGGQEIKKITINNYIIIEKDDSIKNCRLIIKSTMNIDIMTWRDMAKVINIIEAQFNNEKIIKELKEINEKIS